MRQEKLKKRRGERAKFCFLRMSKVCKLIFCIRRIRRPWSVRLVNGFVVSSSSFLPDSEEKMAQLSSKHIFQWHFQEVNRFKKSTFEHRTTKIRPLNAKLGEKNKQKTFFLFCDYPICPWTIHNCQCRSYPLWSHQFSRSKTTLSAY